MKQRKVKQYLKNNPGIFEESFASSKKYNLSSYDGKIEKPDWLEERVFINEKRRLKLKAAYLTCAFICAVVLFIAVTPPGQALAKKAYKMLIAWSDGIVTVQYSSNGQINMQANSVPAEYDSLKDARAAQAFPIAGTESYKLCSISLDTLENAICIKSKYELASGAFIHLEQTSHSGKTGNGAAIQSTGQPVDVNFDGDKRAVGYVDENGSYAISYFENSELEIYTELSGEGDISSSVSYDEFVKFISTVTVN